MAIFNVALLQLLQDHDLSGNLKKGIEFCRIASQRGADLALFPEMWNNGYYIPGDDEDLSDWKSQAISQQDEFILTFRKLAKELNMTGIALTNYAGGVFGGHSMAFDGMAFTEARENKDGDSRDMLLLEADEKEGIHFAKFDLDTLRKYRNSETWGNAYRKPAVYSSLISYEVNDPFIRGDSRNRV
jgi:predicted amidohydrolase